VVGIENLLAEPVRGVLVETVKSPSGSKMAHQRLPEWAEKPSDLAFSQAILVREVPSLGSAFEWRLYHPVGLRVDSEGEL
jgi:hypothetical protein